MKRHLFLMARAMVAVVSMIFISCSKEREFDTTDAIDGNDVSDKSDGNMPSLNKLGGYPVDELHKQYSDLPAVYIVTHDSVPITSKEEYIPCSIHYVDEAGRVTVYEKVSIRGRGNSTWKLAKKPYRLKFDKKVELLGGSGANSKKWNLLANAVDKSMIRNALTFALGEFTSLAWNPSSKFADLVVNGEYMGTYQITDQIEVNEKRVDISGGYLLEVDGFKDGNYFTTSSYKVPVRIRYPDEENITDSQKSYIRSYVRAFEASLKSSDFADPKAGYRAYVDETSLIDWYLCTEISANYDGFWSIYFYKKQNDPKLYWGPLWDFDIAYNNEYRVKTKMGLESSVHSLISDISTSAARAWAECMWRDPWFRNAVNCRYRDLLKAGLVDYMLGKVDSLKTVIYQSQILNYQKWGIDTLVYHEIVLYPTYDKYIDDLKTFICDHCAYLEEEFSRRAEADS
jgi:hypothetical protein